MHMHAQLGRACMYFLKGEKEKPLAVACLKGKLKDWVLKINMLHPSFPNILCWKELGDPHTHYSVSWSGQNQRVLPTFSYKSVQERR